jgi:CHAD domain-containing protein
MSRLGKWIDGLSSESSVSEAARLSLDARLAAVTYWLPLAATYAHHDIEYVHRLRVATRRAAAALKLYRGWLPRRPARWLKRRLRKIRRAAGDARDLDVLIARLRQTLGPRGDDLLADLVQRRAAAQRAISAARDSASRENRMRCKVDRLLSGIAPRGHVSQADRQRPFRDWAAERISTIANRFFAAIPDDSDRAALHQFRICGKRLRYAMELLAPAFGLELRETYYPVVEELQERLGRINDYATGSDRLRQWSESADDCQRRALLDECVEHEQTQLAQELDAYRQWWTPQQAESLRQGLLGNGAVEEHSPSPLGRASG